MMMCENQSGFQSIVTDENSRLACDDSMKVVISNVLQYRDCKYEKIVCEECVKKKFGNCG